MRPLCLLRFAVPFGVLAAVIAAPALAQPDAPMAPFAFLVGSWAGDATYVRAGGERQHLRQTEDVQVALGGQVLLIRGEGRDESGELAFEALGVLSRDPQTGAYYLDAWNDGRHVRADVTPVDGGLDWSFDVGDRAIRYEMRLDDEGRWTETGRMVMPDGQAFPFVEMTLTKRP